VSTLLQLDSSPQATSVSRELTAEFVRTWRASHPDGDVIQRDLAAAPPPVIGSAWIAAAYTPEEQLTEQQKQELAASDALIAELLRADEYVIGVAMHNFTVPTVLKLWVDQIVRKGVTFSYSAAGAEGLLKGKKATVIVASGGVYAEGTPAAAMNFADPYLRSILAFIGVTDVRFVSAGGTIQVAMGAVDRPTFLQPILQEVRAAAA